MVDTQPTLWIDESRYQGKPDYARAKAAGLTGIIHNVDDPEWSNRVHEAKAQALEIALYKWLYAAHDPRDDAVDLVNKCRSVWDLNPKFNWVDHEEGAPDQAPRGLLCLETVRAGIPEIPVELYSGGWFINQAYTTRPLALAEFGLVDAAYGGGTPPAPPLPWSTLAGWQFTSTGVEPGYLGYVDKDWIYGVISNNKPGVIHVKLNKPVVGGCFTPSGKGYYLVCADGGVFPFGDAQEHSYGSEGGVNLNAPIVGMSVTPSGNGYMLYAADGGVFPFGDAPGLGSLAG